MQTHKGKHIWIIGASSGIGYALAKDLAAQGARLILSARSEDRLQSLNTDLGAGHQILPLDVGSHKAVIAAAEQIEQLDSVIFMAAIYAPHSHQPKETAFMHKMLRVNVGGAFNTVNAVLPKFQQQGYGQIALCASVAGYRGLPYGQPYGATKAALINYAESLKIEFENKNIDVKVINPGFVRTPLTDKNDFPMPMIIEADKAAMAITAGLLERVFEIHFPKRFTLIMKLIDALPRFLYFPLARLMKKEQLS